MSDWTMVTLKEYFEAKMAAEAELRKARREDDLLAAEHQNSALSDRLNVMNRFRSQIQDERADFARTDYVEEQVKGVTLRVDATNDRVALVERIQFKIIGGLVLATFVVPVITALVVYLLTRHAISTAP